MAGRWKVTLGIFFLAWVSVNIYLIFFWHATSRSNFETLGKTTAMSTFPVPEPTAVVASSEWSILLAGDVIPARVVNQKMVAKKDFAWPLRNISQLLSEADLTLINLEAPLLSNCPVTTEGMKFCGDARFAQTLSDSGVDVVNLANNHTLNYGWEGLGETVKHLAEVGIETTGFTFSPPVISNEVRDLATGGSASLDFSAKPRNDQFECEKNTFCSKFSTSQIKGVYVGFLGYNAVGQRVDRGMVEQQIREADTQVDVLVVSVHWGREYVRVPQADPGLAPDDPKELGRLFIDWGANVVIGNHPHWYQGFVWVGDKPIFYALGNTVFDQEWSQETKVGYLARLSFKGSTLDRDSIEIFPIGIRDYGEAYLLEGEKKEEVLDFLKIP